MIERQWSPQRGGEMERVLQEFVQEVHGLYGEDLVAVFLYGSAVTGEHVPGRSDINVGVVLRHLAPTLLRQSTSHLRRWARHGFATPLFFDRQNLHDSLDVFPMEFLDMQERHRTLWGPDLFADLRIERHNLRVQCEQELRGKLMKLRQSYVESGHAPSHLEHILMAASSSLVALARTLLRLSDNDPAGDANAVYERLQNRFAVSTTALRKVSQLKQGHIRVAGSGLEELYRDVLEEVQGLVKVVDGMDV